MLECLKSNFHFLKYRPVDVPRTQKHSLLEVPSSNIDYLNVPLNKKHVHSML